MLDSKCLPVYPCEKKKVYRMSLLSGLGLGLQAKELKSSHPVIVFKFGMRGR